LNLNELIFSEELHVKRLQELVQESIREEQLLTRSLLEAESDFDLSLSQRLADRVASFGGSWKFIVSFGVFIFIWIVANLYWLKSPNNDPYPFIFLNLILSCVAALQAPVIMMSQNRQEEKDRQRSRSDYLINLKAEMEIRGLHSKIDLLLAEEMKTLFKIQQSQLELLQQIQGKLDLKS
jgi:uncharacterized membrane protein